MRIRQKNKFCVGETAEVMKPDGGNLQVTVRALYDGDGTAVSDAPHAGQVLWVDLGPGPDVNDIIRRQEAAADGLDG